MHKRNLRILTRLVPRGGRAKYVCVCVCFFIVSSMDLDFPLRSFLTLFQAYSFPINFTTGIDKFSVCTYKFIYTANSHFESLVLFSLPPSSFSLSLFLSLSRAHLLRGVIVGFVHASLFRMQRDVVSIR